MPAIRRLLATPVKSRVSPQVVAGLQARGREAIPQESRRVAQQRGPVTAVLSRPAGRPHIPDVKNTVAIEG